MKDAATIKMLQELGAFILAGAKGAKDVKTMAEMICGARGWRWVGVYKLTRGELHFIAGSDDEPPCYKVFRRRRGSAARQSSRVRRWW